MTAPLHPRGTLRARFEPGMARPRDVFRRLGVGARSCDLGDQGLYLAEELVAADVGWLGQGEQPEALAILVLALMIAQRQGSTRLPLDPRGPLRALVAEIIRLAALPLDTARVLRTITHLTSAPRFNSVIGAHEARLPLVVEDGCLYTERSRWLEHRVATRLAARLAPPAPNGDDTPAALDGFLDELRAAAPGRRALTEEQIAAVRVALTGRISVVTGGPGTGKTVVAAAIVRGLARLGIGNIALAAQTGKAANRLTEVIGQQLGHGGEAPVAQTLHRLLGYRGGRFMHHAQSPLPVGAVLVDEASMIDLELVDALLDALPPAAPLVLIGDAHQLPAIDAGQVLADLAEPDGVATPRVGTLRHSFRMDMDDVHGRAVYEAARAVHDGELQRLFDRRHPLAVPRTPGTLAFRGVELVDTAPFPGKHSRPQETTLAVATTLWHHVEGPRILRLAERVFAFHEGRVAPEQRDELEALWRLLGRARILTATRALPTGSLAINEHLHELALERMSVAGRPDFVPGEPVMITANDYQRGLFNGDQGIVVRADEGLGRHHYRAVFRCGGELRPFAIEALRDRLELAWALTVHKSQGSELDAIALVLPHEDLPLLTRELLYTGITRARTGVAIAGSRAILLAAGKRRALRYSGLGPRLRRLLTTSSARGPAPG
ncbi:MAG: exodeoxyribonuclease V subunit alpha [Deltaproteobacteria bacterium]|nr:exodeoxyribonuclease V subunit alpha [Deltaproteobacteria bacterium]